MRDKIRRIHFVGVGGAGMSGLAEIFCNLGFAVSGSDITPASESAALTRLARLGAPIARGHAAANIEGADCVVFSAAVAADNPECAAAKAAGAPLVARAEMLGELMRFKKGVAVCGTHGKTTTTSLFAAVLGAAGLDPTFVIGGRLRAAEGGARLGGGEHLVAEADESDGSFAHLRPVIAAVTNVDNDHLEAYGGRISRLVAAFARFLARLPFYGAAILCVDDKRLARVARRINRRALTYGFSPRADFRAVDYRPRADGVDFRLVWPGGETEFFTPLFGRHNTQNVLAACALAAELDIPIDTARRAMAEFGGVGRRLECAGRRRIGGKTVEVFDDYAHHPTEITASLAALRDARRGRRVAVVFQPHRPSRTAALLPDLARALAAADAVCLTEVYAAGETPRAGGDGDALFAQLRRAGGVGVFSPRVEDRAAIESALAQFLRDDDIVVTMGAGSISALAAAWRADPAPESHPESQTAAAG